MKELRREQGVDQRGLAETLKRWVSWVSQVERGEIEVVDVGMIQRLAVALYVPSRELIELVLGDEAGELEAQRPFVEVLRIALAGHPAPLAVLGIAAPTKLKVSTDDLLAEVKTAWKMIHASEFEGLGPLLAQVIPGLLPCPSTWPVRCCSVTPPRPGNRLEAEEGAVYRSRR